MSIATRRLLSVVAGILAGVVLASGAFCVLHLYSSLQAARGSTDELSSTVASTDLPVLFDTPQFGYPDQDGKLVTEHDLKGVTWICDFFYSRCTTACPILTARLILLQHSIKNPNIKFVSFSVDPSYDTPGVLKAYAAQWHGDESRWRLLATGTDEAVHATARGMDLPLQRTGDASNPILHSNRFLLFDAAGQARGIYDSTDSDDMTRLAKDANTLAGEGPPELLQDATVTAGADASSSTLAGGRQLFLTMGCVACHSRPAVAPPLEGLAGSEVMLSDGSTVLADDAYLHDYIVSPNVKVVMGYPPVMPNYRSYLSDAQVDGIVAYLKTLARAHPATSSPRSLAIDPVCGMQVSAGPDTPNITYGGKTYYFCSETCREKFQTAPGKYIKP